MKIYSEYNLNDEAKLIGWQFRGKTYTGWLYELDELY